MTGLVVHIDALLMPPTWEPPSLDRFQQAVVDEAGGWRRWEEGVGLADIGMRIDILAMTFSSVFLVGDYDSIGRMRLLAAMCERNKPVSTIRVRDDWDASAMVRAVDFTLNHVRRNENWILAVRLTDSEIDGLMREVAVSEHLDQHFVARADEILGLIERNLPIAEESPL
jgi:hypothetical protein